WAGSPQESGPRSGGAGALAPSGAPIRTRRRHPMDNDTDDTNETDAEISAPRGCAACMMGVAFVDGLNIRACARCSHTARGHRADQEAAGLVCEALAALADIR